MTKTAKTPKAEKAAPKTPKAETKKAPKVETPAPKAAPVRKSKFSGTILVRLVEANPRRAKTHGSVAFGFYAPNVNEGVRYEDWRSKVDAEVEKTPTFGGLNHLQWDIDKGFVKAVPASEFKGKVQKV